MKKIVKVNLSKICHSKFAQKRRKFSSRNQIGKCLEYNKESQTFIAVKHKLPDATRVGNNIFFNKKKNCIYVYNCNCLYIYCLQEVSFKELPVRIKNLEI